MELSELEALLTPEGLRLLDAMPPVDSSDDVARTVTRLRRDGHSPDLVSAVVGQARLRTRARAKFGDLAERMLFTRAGLEQATRLGIAARHAARFRDAGFTRVADLGCGIGGDALGLAGLGLRVTAVDADEVTAGIAAYNLAPFGADAEVRLGAAEDTDLDGIEAAWLDPARRTAGHSETARTRPEDWSPSLDWVFDLARRMPVGVKLGPGLDRDLIPDHVEAQWVSADGATVELVLWSGALARPGVRRAALVIRGDQAHEMTAETDAADEPARELGAFLHEPDGAVIRARLIGDVARTLEAGMLDEHIAYLTSDAALTSPFVSTFRVREVLPADEKALGKALRERDIGRLEIKKRGVDVDPATLRTRLKLRGSAAATLLLTRIGTRRTAILADRV
ncbi:SAM-dependent methyltransferase [Microbacterium trichothecenolyticum]|uniref:class I SAM-dependent methyltransferase n=1 Tax=Microbacterium trichothecenolyticum TaxID=69370 RepID=UPI00285BDB50|nr:class I SAM-dependent methyltransferase [Microbacterium trichothecenolyticum]MDR7184951.1 SAM-dependent methyltransferase [Microbacterium trichothecenolyticum]